MNESQRRAFEALGLGPIWLGRHGGSSVESDVDIEVVASAAFESALASQPTDATDRVVEAANTDVGQLDWEALAQRIAACQACSLCESRRQTVFGVGPRKARWMIIGEAPGAEEDVQGEPFVGQAGRLLDNMLISLGMSRQKDVFIANVLKCRPPQNRNPKASEVLSCSPYLRRQMALVDPELIVLMGKFAAATVLGIDEGVGRLRRRVHPIDVNGRQVPAIVTYHPAYLLRALNEKAKAWRDLQFAVREHQRVTSAV